MNRIALATLLLILFATAAHAQISNGDFFTERGGSGSISQNFHCLDRRVVLGPVRNPKSAIAGDLPRWWFLRRMAGILR